MEVAKSMKRMIHMETCSNVLFVGGRRKKLRQEERFGVYGPGILIIT
jgi:hypothetical protein